MQKTSTNTFFTMETLQYCEKRAKQENGGKN